MTVANYSNYKADLDDLCELAVNNAEPIIVVRDNSKNVVIISEEEYNSITETLYLMHNPANYQHLLKAETDGAAVKMTFEEFQVYRPDGH